jgi:hypothetical protein
VSPIGLAAIAFGCSFGGALIGMVLHVRLPDRHLDGDAKDVVKLVMGLIATMAALVLSLLIASAKNSYDTQSGDLTRLSVNIVQLDRLLALYGTEAKPARDILRQIVSATYEATWTREGVRTANLDPSTVQAQAGAFYAQLQDLSPHTEAQRSVLSRAMQLAAEIQRTRLLMFEALGNSISWPFLTILVFWLAVLFVGFGLFARFNATVLTSLFIGAISVAGALFLLMELNQPYQGLMRISGAPLREALARIDQ